MSFFTREPDTTGAEPPEHEQWVALARTLAREFALTVVERERDGILPRAEIQTLKEAGLINLLIPRELGGEGGSFATAVQVVQEISKGDGSLGALLAFQYWTSSVPRFLDPRTDAEAITRRSAQGRWFWGNLHVPEVEATPNGRGGFTVNGTKRWSTASGLSDVATVVARRTDVPELLFAVVPTDRPGFIVHHDWDHLGLRLAETVTVETVDLEVREDEIFRTQAGPIKTLPGLFLPVASTFSGALFVGSSWAAFERARDYTLTRPPRMLSRAISPADGAANRDIPTLTRFGQLWGPLKAADALVREAGAAIDEVWSTRPDISEDDVDELTRRAVTARAYSQDVALTTTQSVYDITGTSAAANRFGFDRHWRDVRTWAQHDPVVHLLRQLGENYIAGTPIRIPALV